MAEQADSKAPYVFLSYASVEQERALAIGDVLQQAGIAIWLDRHAIAGGSAWSTEIVRGIRDCAAFVVLGSERAFRSPNVQRELNLAVEENRPVLPLLLEQVTAPDDVRYALAGRQWVSLLEREQAAWLPEVLRALAGLGVIPAVADTAAEPDPAPIEPLTNLPASLTSFLGREQELADLARLVLSNRLMTLTGPGGTGKTRLALQVTLAQVERFPDGVFFVDLAPLADPALVPSAVAQALGVPRMPEIPLRDSVLRFVREKQLLLVLDNYEHLLAAAEFPVALLQAGPGVTVLATSRAPLRVRGEREYPVSPLPLPSGASPTAIALAKNPTVALFVTRAQDVRPDFMLTDANATTIAAICTRLDGLPLAIELAAARVRVLPPAALLARLEQRLPVLTGGARDTPLRQQTLRDTIAWSFDLLDAAEQRLFWRLAVFAGSCTLVLAEAVCNADRDLGIDLLDGVSSLLEKSLLREADGFGGEPRYRMLETIREFALGELEASGEAEAARRQLAVQVLQLTRQCASSSAWARLDDEIDNIRAVLGWCIEHEELSLGVRLLWALTDYRYRHGFGREGEEWRLRLLSLPEAALPTVSRARLLAARVTSFVTETERSESSADLEQAITISAHGDTNCLALCLLNLAQNHARLGHYDLAWPLAEEALPLWIERGLTTQIVQVRNTLGVVALNRGDLAEAEALEAANTALQREAGTRRPSQLGIMLALSRGDLVRGRAICEEATRFYRAQGEDSPDRASVLPTLAAILVLQGDTQAAVQVCAESLTFHQRLGQTMHLQPILGTLAQAAGRAGLMRRSAMLLGANGGINETRQGLSGLRFAQEAVIEQMRSALGEAAFAEAWAEGEALSADATVELGLVVVAELQQVLAGTAAMEPG